MRLLDRAFHAAKKSNGPAILAGLVLIGTYALTLALTRPAPRHQAEATPLAPAAPGAALPPVPPPDRRGWPFWKHVVSRTYAEVNDDRLLALAAGVVFYALLALFPAITALVSSYALFAKPSTITGHLALVGGLMPQSAYSVVDEQVTRIVTRTTGNLSAAFFVGLALALWSANAGVKAIMDALNSAYGVKERRGFIRLNLISLGFTVSLIVGLLLAIAAIVVLPVVLSFLPDGMLKESALTWARWPVLMALLLVGLAVLYRFGPDLDNARFRWISPGAVLAAFAWISGSALLSWYLHNFADYDATYGSLGAGIGLMMWLWMSAIVVLVGAEFNSEIDRASHAAAESDALADHIDELSGDLRRRSEKPRKRRPRRAPAARRL